MRADSWARTYWLVREPHRPRLSFVKVATPARPIRVVRNRYGDADPAALNGVTIGTAMIIGRWSISLVWARAVVRFMDEEV